MRRRARVHGAGRLNTSAACVRERAHTCANVYKGVCACMCLCVPVERVHVEHACACAHVCVCVSVCIPLLCAGVGMSTEVAGLPWRSRVPSPGPHSLLCTVSLT